MESWLCLYENEQYLRVGIDGLFHFQSKNETNRPFAIHQPFCFPNGVRRPALRCVSHCSSDYQANAARLDRFRPSTARNRSRSASFSSSHPRISPSTFRIEVTIRDEKGHSLGGQSERGNAPNSSRGVRIDAFEWA